METVLLTILTIVILVMSAVWALAVWADRPQVGRTDRGAPTARRDVRGPS